MPRKISIMSLHLLFGTTVRKAQFYRSLVAIVKFLGGEKNGTKIPRTKCVSVKCALLLKLRIHRTIVVKTSESLHVFFVVIGLIQDLVVFSRRYFLSVFLDDDIDSVNSVALGDFLFVCVV